MTPPIELIMANMRHATRNRGHTEIGGGLFSPEEIKQALEVLEIAQHLLPALDSSGITNLFVDFPGHHPDSILIGSSITRLKEIFNDS